MPHNFHLLVEDELAAGEQVDRGVVHVWYQHQPRSRVVELFHSHIQIMLVEREHHNIQVGVQCELDAPHPQCKPRVPDVDLFWLNVTELAVRKLQVWPPYLCIPGTRQAVSVA